MYLVSSPIISNFPFSGWRRIIGDWFTMSNRKKQEREQEQKTERRLRILAILFPVLFLLYEEILLKGLTVGVSFDLTLLFTVLFSAAYGILLFAVTSLTDHPKLNRFFRFLLYFVLAFIIGAYYFEYRTFKMFYDLRTVLSGGVDAIGGFSEQVGDLLFNVPGMLKVLVFMAPVILYLFTAKYFDSGKKLREMEPFFLVTLFILTYVGGVLAISFSQIMYGVYTSEYSFQTAAEDFGMMTGIRLDAEHLILRRDSEMSFEVMNEEVEEAETEEVIEEEKPVIYGYNELDIDYETLMETDSALERQLDEYTSNERPSRQNEFTGLFKGKNLIFISAEAFSAEVIDPERTPTLYRLATKGINFTDYYQPASAGTTGGEYENVFGLLPTEGGSSFKITSHFTNELTMGSVLNDLGYNGWAFHNNDYTFYDRHITHNNLGYSNGYMGYGNGIEEYVTSQFPESDLEMIEGTMDLYIDQEPFNVYYMSVSGHSTYNLGNAMSKKHWDEVKDLEGYTDAVKCYFAANLELEDAMTCLVNRLEKEGIADDTVIVIAADHFPYGLDYGEDIDASDNLANLYGYKVTNYLERDHNRLIIWSGCLEDSDPVIVDSPTSSLDILPTLLNLFGAQWDSRLLPGRDVFSDRKALVFTLNYDWKTDKGTFYAGLGKFVPNEGVTVTDAYVENMRKTVRNKISYCKGLLQTDYIHHVLSGVKEE